MIRSARATSPARDASATLFNAPLFRSAIERLDTGKRCVVLDLGAACSETITLLGDFRCRLDIADVAAGLAGMTDEQADGNRDLAVEALLPAPHDDPADLVLCWDLLNYLNLPAIDALMRAVARRCRPGSLVHCLIVYAAATMPARPCQYVPQADLGLRQLVRDARQTPAPRYSPEALGNALSDFQVERAMLLGNGMQEFLFRH